MASPLSLALQAKAIVDAAREEGRPLTREENREVTDLIARSNTQSDVEKMSKSLGSPTGAGPTFNVTSSGGPGDQFVMSEGYKRISDPTSRPQSWSTGAIPLEMKGTLLQTTAGGPGGGLVPPEYQQGVVSKLFEPLVLPNILGQSQTSASQVRYVVEGTATSGAAGVAEAGTKPESTVAYSEVVEPVKKIATVLPISDEMLDDAPSIQSYLNERLSAFVTIEEERQILRGNGTNELIGFFNRAGNQAINLYTRLSADDNSVALAKVIANTRGSSFVEPDTIVMHPTNWLNTRLLRDGAGGTAGQYFGGGPFTSAYGGGATPAGMFGGSLWGKPVVLSTVVGLGTALVGNFRSAAHLWRRGGLSVEATNSHGTLFVQNITMIRAESRAALGLYRPSAFTGVVGLT
jgi:HK97 family phage major capsid protein